MHCCLLPASTTKALDKLARDFLWFDEPNKRKIHLIGWNSVCLPKHKGGLGIRQCAKLNEACILKLIWRFNTGPPSPWTCLLKTKYGSLTPPSNPPQSASHIWRAMSTLMPSFSQGISWCVNNGKSVNFFHDDWLPTGPLSHILHGPLTLQEANSTVADVSFFLSSFRQLPWNLPPEFERTILTQLELADPSHNDSITWKLSPNGSFSLSSAYTLTSSSAPFDEKDWHWIWKCPTLPKIRFFLWLLAHERVASRSLLSSRGINIPNTCPRCNTSSETALHLIRDCPNVLPLWKALPIPKPLLHSFHFDTFKWLHSNCTSKLLIEHPRLPWASIFCSVVWYLWNDRNSLCFRQSSNLQSIHSKSLSLAAELWAACERSYRTTSYKFLPVKWNPPNNGWVKLNCDGSYFHHTGRIGAEGVLRNCNGDWILGFSKNLGFGTNNDAEFWGVKLGLKLALDLGFRRLEIEADSLLVINTINGAFAANASHKPLIQCCRSLILKFDEVRIKHVYREANGVADILAKYGASMEEHFVTFDSIPHFCMTCYSHDREDRFVYRTMTCHL
ncbi:hypothetical protein SLA2020_359870 [Shorea laevis]